MSKSPKSNKTEHYMALALDARAAHSGVADGIAKQIQPILTQALKEQWSREKLLNHPTIKLLIAARGVSIALMEPDSQKAMGAIKNIEDRVEGKPTEKLEIKGRLEKTSDDELDALIASRLGQDDFDEDNGEH